LKIEKNGRELEKEKGVMRIIKAYVFLALGLGEILLGLAQRNLLISDFLLPGLILPVVALFSLFRGVRFGRRRERPADLLPDRLLSPVDFMRHSYKLMISASRVAGSRRATVLFPESQPPVSPGLRRVVFPCFLISGL